MPKVRKNGKEWDFPYTKKGRAAAARRAEKVGANVEEELTPSVLAVQRKQERDPTSVISKRASQITLKKPMALASQRQKFGLRTRGDVARGKSVQGTNPSARRVKRSLGIAASTKMDWRNKLVEMITERVK